MQPEEFISWLRPVMVKKSLGIPISFMLAQAALESSWGKSELATRANNLFGVKADDSWKGATWDCETLEYVDGKPVKVVAKWRLYSGVLESMKDHVKFLRENPRYAEAFKHPDGQGFARAIARAGYATDPKYADKLCFLIRHYKLEQYDNF